MMSSTDSGSERPSMGFLRFFANWSHFSRFAGGVIGQTLAMEGMFAFFLESAFLGLFLYGEKRLGPRGHWWSAPTTCCGGWSPTMPILSRER